MISSCTISQMLDALAPSEWGDIPNLAVITGENGSGKSQFLRLLQQWSAGQQRGGCSVVINPILPVHYVPATWQPTDLAPNPQAQRQQAHNERQNFYRYAATTGQPANAAYDRVLTKIETTLRVDRENLTGDQIAANLPADFDGYIASAIQNSYIIAMFDAYFNKEDQTKLEAHDTGKILSSDELASALGMRAPWIEINELFVRFGFKHTISIPIRGVDYTPTFAVSGTSQRIPFSQLSDGEKTIVNLILWSYNSNINAHHNVFLLDEIDAHLNPKMSQMLMTIIKEKLVDEYGIQVIMTTHSPSTVAHAPSDSIFYMEGGNLPRRISKSEAIEQLSDGIMVIAADSDLIELDSALETGNDWILFVEGPSDVSIIKNAWNKTRPDAPLPFEILDGECCTAIFKKLIDSSIVDEKPTKKFVALLDFDDALISLNGKIGKLVTAGKWKKQTTETPDSIVFRRSDKRLTFTSLPIPDHRRQYAHLNATHNNLEIEHFFEDQVITELCETFMPSPGVELIRMKDKNKTSFSTSTSGLPEQAFEHFSCLFDHLIAEFDHLESATNHPTPHANN